MPPPDDGASSSVRAHLPPVYVDVQASGAGSFFYAADGAREVIEYDGDAAGLAMHVPYELLEPFVVDAGTGLGLRCRRPIRRGEHIVEFVGEVLDDVEVRRAVPPAAPCRAPHGCVAYAPRPRGVQVRARYDEAVPLREAHYLMSLGDNATLQAKLRRGDTSLGDSELFVDQAVCGNHARFANDEEENPNVAVAYWPPPPRPGAPREPGRARDEA